MSKFKVPFEFGEKVLVKSIPHKIKFPDKRRVWIGSNGVDQKYEFVEPKEAIYLGYRNLYDGIVKYGNSYRYMDEPEYSYLKVTKTHRAALICRKGHKPEYAFLADIEKIKS